jgi:hypothetical protein
MTDEKEVDLFATWLTMVTAAEPAGTDTRPSIRQRLKENPGFDPIDVLAFFIGREIANGFGEEVVPLVNFQNDAEAQPEPPSEH